MYAQTRRQREVYDFIIEYTERHGYRPSYQMIAREIGVRSRSGIARIVHDLESQGLLSRQRENGHFALTIGNGGDGLASNGPNIQWLEIPDTGERLEEWQQRPFILPDFLVGFQPDSHIRAFRVPDGALAATGICEGDIALIELRQFVRDGNIVAAIVSKKYAVLRRYARAGAHIELSGDDADTEAVSIAADMVMICGIYRGLLRPII